MKFSNNNPNIDKELKEFIEKNISLIEAEEFDELYKHAYNNPFALDTGSLTHVLYSVGIDPLDHLDYIPASFLKSCDALTEIEIPTHIEHVDESAFYDCNSLEGIVIPKNVVELASWSLGGCEQLKQIVILGDLKRIGSLAFSQNPKLEVIYCTESVSDMLKSDRKIIGPANASHIKIKVIR